MEEPGVVYSLSLSQTIPKTRGVSVLCRYASACWAGHLKNMLGLGHPQLVLPGCAVWDAQDEAGPDEHFLLTQGSQRDTVPSLGLSPFKMRPQTPNMEKAKVKKKDLMFNYMFSMQK